MSVSWGISFLAIILQSHCSISTSILIFSCFLISLDDNYERLKAFDCETPYFYKHECVFFMCVCLFEFIISSSILMADCWADAENREVNILKLANCYSEIWNLQAQFLPQIPNVNIIEHLVPTQRRLKLRSGALQAASVYNWILQSWTSAPALLIQSKPIKWVTARPHGIISSYYTYPFTVSSHSQTWTKWSC